MEIANDNPLPTDNEYIDGSFQINAEMTQYTYDLEQEIK